MADLIFGCTGATAERYAVTPTLGFQLTITERSGVRIHAIALRCQIRIEPHRRRYSATEAERLHDLFGELAPDVEAILVNRTELGNEVFLIPIDMCYSLVGELRMYWTGFDGGAEVRTALARFLTGLRHRAVPLERRAAHRELGH